MAVLPGLSAQEQQVLSRYRLLPRRRGVGTHGERLSQSQGMSHEFRDFREYADGDDLRHFDWNVLARLGQRVVRTYQDEQELKVTLVLDASASMTSHDPAKWETARAIAGALGFVALQGGDALQSFAIGRGGTVRSLRGYTATGRLAHWLDEIPEPSEAHSLRKGCEAVVNQLKGPGITILISDGLEPDAESSLRAFVRRQQELWWVQVLSEDELDPGLTGDLELVDVDLGHMRTTTITDEVREGYRSNLSAHINTLSAAATRSGGKAMLVKAGATIESLIRDVWRPQRWIG
ncbi:MAG: DUF58 domain-containing protein [Armatimonadetes bacterium]|nr:DUF58 domain-containing protein [Armatimonadota bacterium]